MKSTISISNILFFYYRQSTSPVFMKQLVIDISPESSRGVFSFLIYDYPNPSEYHLLDKHDIICGVANVSVARIVDSSLTPVGVSFPLSSTNPVIRQTIDRYSSSITIFTRSGNTSPHTLMESRWLLANFAKQMDSYSPQQLLNYLKTNHIYMNIPTLQTYMKRFEEHTEFLKDATVQKDLRLLSRHCALGGDISKKILFAVNTTSFQKLQSILDMATKYNLHHTSEYGRATRLPPLALVSNQGSFFPVIHCFMIFCMLTAVVYAIKYANFFQTMKSI